MNKRGCEKNERGGRAVESWRVNKKRFAYGGETKKLDKLVFTL